MVGFKSILRLTFWRALILKAVFLWKKEDFTLYIKDEFFDKFDPNHTLMQNKEEINGKEANRPCFFAFPDKGNDKIFWLIPVSTKVDKYKRIVAHKAQKRAQNNLPPIECDTIRFGEIRDHENAFLIQNMFPITASYILNQFVDKKSKLEVRISKPLEQDIISRAEKVLILQKKGRNLIFSDIDTIYKQLTEELAAIRS